MTSNLKDELNHYRALARVEDDSPDDTGRFKAVFPFGPQGTQAEEEYITRMILRDREANVGY